MPAAAPALAPADRIRAAALAEGFDYVAFAPAAPLSGAREAAARALDEGRLAGMAWMTQEWLDRATEPGRFLEGARSLVVLGIAYRPPEVGLAAGGPARGRIAAYARGRDYHRLFESRLRRLCRVLRDELGASARFTVDYGPLLERPLAQAAGLGWQGKSTMLLVPGAGPWVLLGIIATDLELPPGEPLKKTCGTCTRCIAACPTGAISPEGELDARLCISYHTIENRGPIPRALRPKFGAWIFGCDDCLTSCPVGFKTSGGHRDLQPADLEAGTPALAPLLWLTEEGFRERYPGRAILRAKRDGFLRNVCIALGNTGRAEDVPALAAALGDASALVRGHAAWALGAIAAREPSVRGAALRALEARGATEHDPEVQEELAAAVAELRTDVPQEDRHGHR